MTFQLKRMIFPMLFWILLKALPGTAQAKCGKPQKLSNAYPDTSGTSFEVDAVVRYRCNYGYAPTTSSVPTVKCLSSGSWTEARYECNPITCSAPQEIDFASHSGNSSFGDSVIYKCDPGYEFTGQITKLTCLGDGKWDPLAPSDCEVISCLPIDALGNLDFSPHNTQHYGTVVQYSCKNGFSLIGSKSQTCEQDGTWSGSQPTCKDVQCKKPEWDIENGQAMDVPKDQYIYKEIVRYKCSQNYVPQPSEISCQEDNEWSATVICVFTGCHTPPPIDNGDVLGPFLEYAIGDSASYVCHHGYKTIDSERVFCSRENQWSQPPTCVLVKCDSPPPVVHGEMKELPKAVYVYKDKVSYSCDDGYEPQLNSEMTCQMNGQWSTSPVCVLNRDAAAGSKTTTETNPNQCVCRGHPEIHNGKCHTSKRVYACGEEILCHCNNMYTLDGNDKVTCQSNGQWSALPHCLLSVGTKILIAAIVIIAVVSLLSSLYLFCTKKLCFAPSRSKSINKSRTNEQDVPLNDNTVVQA